MGKRIVVIHAAVVGRPPRLQYQVVNRLITRNDAASVQPRQTPGAWFDLGPYFVEFTVPTEVAQKLQEAEDQFNQQVNALTIIPGTVVEP